MTLACAVALALAVVCGALIARNVSQSSAASSPSYDYGITVMDKYLEPTPGTTGDKQTDCRTALLGHPAGFAGYDSAKAQQGCEAEWTAVNR